MSYFPDTGKKKFPNCQLSKSQKSLISSMQQNARIQHHPKYPKNPKWAERKSWKKPLRKNAYAVENGSSVLPKINNKIHPFEFADCFRNLLIIGRGKCRNIFIPNCGKTFLLKPLEDIFLIFSVIDTTVG